MRMTWVQPEDLLPHELAQCAAEGIGVTDIATQWRNAGGSIVPAVSGASATPVSPADRRTAMQLLNLLGERHNDATREATAAPPQLPTDHDGTDADLATLTGAWVGRAAGCLAGKVVEKIPRHGIAAILQSSGQWPMSDYITAVGVPEAVLAEFPWNRRSRPTSLRENIDGMPEDDDLNFAIMALRLLESVGPTFTTDDVATAWLADLPAGRVFTAERIAYRNLLSGLEAPQTAYVGNPFREWIGAQIRTDVYGWTHPGRPVAAAQLAWVDARLSHTRNGIYSAMWVAAMGSLAAVYSDPAEVIEQALQVVPVDSALATAVRFGVGIAHDQAARAESLDWGLDRLHDRYGTLHWVHSLNNSALIAYALVSSGGDFTAAVRAAVSGGWDTDSVGATVGGICGMLGGVELIGAQWTAPLRDQIYSSLPGAQGLSLSDLARRTLAVSAR